MPILGKRYLCEKCGTEVLCNQARIGTLECCGEPMKIREAKALLSSDQRNPMKPLPHIYKAQLSGGPEGYAVVSVPGIPELRTAPPADFDGPGDAWSPEQFLMAAVETCFLFTLQAVARHPSCRSRPWNSRARAPSTARMAQPASRRSCFGRACGFPRVRTKTVRFAFSRRVKRPASCPHHCPRRSDSNPMF